MALDESLEYELRSRGARAQAELDEFERTRVNVALIGETGSGKSSLINAIVGSKVARTGGTGETTQQAQAVPHQEIDGLVFWDLPGCGTPNHPRETYIEKQRLLEDFDVFVLVTDKRIRQGDEWLYRTLRKQYNRPVFVVRTHFDQVVDELPEDEARRLITEDVRKQLGAGPELTPYIVALKGPKRYDLGKFVEDVVNSLSGWKQTKAVMAFAALTADILKKKRDAAEKIVGRCALVAAANGLNPVPGLDVSVDLGVLSYMARQVISTYGLREDQLEFAARPHLADGALQVVRRIAKPVTEYLVREAIEAFLKRIGKSIAAKSLAKWVPIAGQAVAAYLGYRLTIHFGETLMDDCEKAAQEIADVLNGYKAA